MTLQNLDHSIKKIVPIYVYNYLYSYQIKYYPIFLAFPSE